MSRLLRTFLLLLAAIPMACQVPEKANDHDSSELHGEDHDGGHGHNHDGIGHVAAVDGLAPAQALAAADDFYLAVNAEWMSTNPIPDEYGSWGVFHEINDRNQTMLREILEQAAVDYQKPGASHITKLLGTMYATGMDEQSAENFGVEAIRQELDMIEEIQSYTDIPPVLGYLHNIGANALFGLGSESDFTDSSQTITFLIQDGTGLPEKDYYFRDDAESEDIREAYVAHIARIFGLAGANADQAADDAESILAFETMLADAGLSALEMRDINRLANRIPIEELHALTPDFSWESYQFILGLDPQPVANVVCPEYFLAWNQMLTEQPIQQWKAYLRWQLLTRSAAYLSSDFVSENFDFFGRKLSGRQAQSDRWKRVLGSVNAGMGEALGQAYVERAFTPEAKELALTMVGDLLEAYRVSLQDLAWMTPTTRKAALKKLDSFTVKIGYPDVWQDFRELELQDGPWVRNVFAATAFQNAVDLARIGKPTDRSLWGMSPQTVNAYYNPLSNEIVFPAAIMQPPFFGLELTMAENYGAMGAIIGHEITHGFDDMGSQFDAQGNLVNWWTEEDLAEFETRSQILIDQFNAYVAIDDLHVNGELTLGENIADLGGLKMAYKAFQMRAAEDPQSMVDGFTPEQQLFRAWARAWRENTRPESLKVQVNTDPHSPNHFRANGPLGNLQEFADAFGLHQDSPMMRPRSERAEIW